MSHQYIVQKVPDANTSGDPIAWTRASDAMREVGMHDLAKICSDTARDLAVDINANDAEVVEIKK